MKKNNSILYGLLASVGLIAFYLTVVSIFQGIEFAFLNFRSLWFWLVPLSAGFGIQIGLYTSIKHAAMVTGTVAGTGAISAGSMVACCSHFLLNVIPIIGLSGVAIFLVKYQTAFFGIGILSNLFGILVMINHKKKMKVNLPNKSGERFSFKRETHLKGGLFN
jgi:hypothetical protein